MERLTHERVNGIKTGYWSPKNKEVLAQRLAEYENTGLNREEVKDVARVCKIYKSVGLTPDRVRELDERDTAKKIKLINGGIAVCPECSVTAFRHYDFCADCGQRLKWK